MFVFQVLAQLTNPVLAPDYQGLSGVDFANDVLPNIILIGLVIGVTVFFFMFMIGALEWIFSGGNRDRVEDARKRITNALTGLLILLLIFVITQIVSLLLGIDIGNLGTGPGTAPTSTPTIPASGCTDTDGGLNYGVRGTVTGTGAGCGTPRTDFCMGMGNILQEQHCGPLDECNSSFYTCPISCVDGACTSAALGTPPATPAALEADLSANGFPSGVTVDVGSVVRFDWSSINAVSCDLDGSEVNPPSGGFLTSEMATVGSFVYVLDCSDYSGNTITDSVTVNVLSLCGDRNIDPGEECDGTNFGGLTCSDFPPFDSGSLICNSCSINLSGCTISPTSTPVLTNTPVPTNTPAPTSTPITSACSAGSFCACAIHTTPCVIGYHEQCSGTICSPCDLGIGETGQCCTCVPNEPTPTPVPPLCVALAPGIYLNSASGRNCTFICNSCNGTGCLSIGTNATADNLIGYMTFTGDNCIPFGPISCNFYMNPDVTGLMCTNESGATHLKSWTYCNCGF